MRDDCLNDIGDYIKYALLREFARTQPTAIRRAGSSRVRWHLTPRSGEHQAARALYVEDLMLQIDPDAGTRSLPSGVGLDWLIVGTEPLGGRVPHRHRLPVGEELPDERALQEEGDFGALQDPRLSIQAARCDGFESAHSAAPLEKPSRAPIARVMN